MPRVEIRELEKVNLKNPVIIEGFPGMGMIGTISSAYLAEKLGMKLVATISSTHFPPVASIHNGVPVSPARIYASERLNLIVLFSEFVIPAEVVYPLAQKIVEYAKQKKASAIYSLAGITTPNVPTPFYGIASTPGMTEQLRQNGFEVIKEGATQGVSGVLVAECALEQFPAANLMVQTSQAMDPRGAAKLLDKLSKVVGIPIDTASLVSEAAGIESKMKAAIVKMSDAKADYKKFESNSMYG
jgi:uncharacterized protein